MAKRRRARGEWCWEMQVVACGGTCCAPLEDRRHCEGRIEQGHIVPEAEGGDDNPDNLIPLCRKHNRKYRKLRAPDSRPAGWRERYIQLLAHDVQPRFCVPHEKFDSRVIAASSATENTDVIAWPQPDFAAANSLYTSPSAARRAAVTLVERIVDASQKLEPRLFPPGERQSTRLRIIAEAYPATFDILVREFFTREDYVLEGWAPVCEKPERYERWALERKRVQKVADESKKRYEDEAVRAIAENDAKQFVLSKQSLVEDAKSTLMQAITMVDEGYSQISEFVEQLNHLLVSIDAATSGEVLNDCKKMLNEISDVIDQLAAAAF